MKLEHRLSLCLNFAWIFILYSQTLKQHRAERIKTVYVWSFSFKSARCATVSQLVFFLFTACFKQIVWMYVFCSLLNCLTIKTYKQLYVLFKIVNQITSIPRVNTRIQKSSQLFLLKDALILIIFQHFDHPGLHIVKVIWVTFYCNQWTDA